MKRDRATYMQTYTITTHNSKERRKFHTIYIYQDAQLSQRDRAAVYISFVRKWKTGTQRQYFTDIVSLASTTVT